MAEFAYHRGLAPFLAMFLCVAGLELVVVHVLVSTWSGWAALVLSLISLSGLIWIVQTIRSFKIMPIIVGSDVLAFRTGRLMCLDVPFDNVSELRAEPTQHQLRQPGIFKMSLLAYPNILLELRTPQLASHAGRKRMVRAVAHRVDDPTGFIRVVSRFVAKPATELSYG